MKDIKTFMASIIEQAIQRASSTGNEDLPLEDAALHAANVIGNHVNIQCELHADEAKDYLVRATDSQGQKLPKENLRAAVQVAGGAGFTTTSTLLSWLIYGLVRILTAWWQRSVSQNQTFMLRICRNAVSLILEFYLKTYADPFAHLSVGNLPRNAGSVTPRARRQRVQRRY